MKLALGTMMVAAGWVGLPAIAQTSVHYEANTDAGYSGPTGFGAQQTWFNQTSPGSFDLDFNSVIGVQDDNFLNATMDDWGVTSGSLDMRSTTAGDIVWGSTITFFVNQVKFQSIDNPSATGTVDVALAYRYRQTLTDVVASDGDFPELNDTTYAIDSFTRFAHTYQDEERMLDTSGDWVYDTTDFITMPLGHLHNFRIAASGRVMSSVAGHGGLFEGNFEFDWELDEVPFVFADTNPEGADGYTMNAPGFDIVNNQFRNSSVVPSPSAAGMVLLTGLAGLARRRRRASSGHDA